MHSGEVLFLWVKPINNPGENMKRFFIGITALLVGLILSVNLAFAANSVVGTTWSSDDVYEVNNATPGLAKTFAGTRLLGPTTTGATTYASGENMNKCAGANATGFTTPTTTVFIKTTGTQINEAYCLGDAIVPGSWVAGQSSGIPAYNQRLTITLATDGGKDFLITPATKTGFANVQLNDANDSVTLRYINATVGWVIDGNNGATIN